MARKAAAAPPPDRFDFVLFKSTNKANRCAYVGSIVVRDAHGVEPCYAIEADVAEHDNGDGTRGKHFAGHTYGGEALVREMVRTGKAEGTLPPDLVALMERPEFDDPLPDNL